MLLAGMNARTRESSHAPTVGRTVVRCYAYKDSSGQFAAAAAPDLDRLLRVFSIEIVPFDQEQLVEARHAFRRFGKGRHRARLNFGDCASYALAQWSGEPLLFKGTDFASTDVPQVARTR